MPEADLLAEAQRQFNICNACRYCESYCAVFPAAELRDAMSAGDVHYLANLCHDCRDCYDACMFAPPHEFAVNIPQLLAQTRVETYARYTWPAPFAVLFRHIGPQALLALAAALAVLIAVALGAGPERLLGVHLGPGAFYTIVPYLALVTFATALVAYGLLAALAGGRRFIADISGATRASWSDLKAATGQALTLHYMKGGGAGCYYPDTRGSNARRVLHHCVFWGFSSALVSTSLAAVYQDVLQREPPFPVLSAPVLFGIAGGILLTVGASGLLLLKRRSDPVPSSPALVALDYAFLILLDTAAISGLLTLVLRSSHAMGSMFALHLAIVAGLFVTAPYGKFMHVVYRYAALVKWAGENPARK